MNSSLILSKFLTKALVFVLVFGMFVSPNIRIAGAEEEGGLGGGLVQATESTEEFCSDGLDNDLDSLIDSEDLDCAPFYVTTNPLENSLELCSDGLDNDLDSLIDSLDPDCVGYTFVETENATSSNNTNSSRRRSSGVSTETKTTTPEGLAPIVSTCVPYITTYMKIGQANNVEEVKLLQKFLNEYASSSLPVTGFFGPLTEAAVKKLQSDETKFILQPWVDQGISKDVTATGFVYKTTLWFINNKKCGDATLPFPNLK